MFSDAVIPVASVPACARCDALPRGSSRCGGCQLRYVERTSAWFRAARYPDKRS